MAELKINRALKDLDDAKREEHRARERYHKGGSARDMVEAMHKTDDAKHYATVRCHSGLHTREHQ